METTPIEEILEAAFGDTIPRSEYPRLERIIRAATRLSGAPGAPRVIDLDPARRQPQQQDQTRTYRPRVGTGRVAQARTPTAAKSSRKGTTGAAGSLGDRAITILEEQGPMTVSELADALECKKEMIYGIANNRQLPYVEYVPSAATGARKSRFYGPVNMTKSELAEAAKEKAAREGGAVQNGAEA